MGARIAIACLFALGCDVTGSVDQRIVDMTPPPDLVQAPDRVPWSVAVADLGGDGKIDVITANLEGNTISILRGNGDGTLGPAVEISVGQAPFAVLAAKLDGDQRPDLVVSLRTPSSVVVLLNQGDGTFRAALSYSGSGPAVAGDWNGDGQIDLATTTGLLLGHGDGTFGLAIVHNAGLGPSAVAAADLDRDGKLDLLVANGGDGSVTALLGNGDGTFRTAGVFTVGAGPASLAVADFDRDGRPDLVTADANYLAQAGNRITVLLGKGDGTFQPAVAIPVGSLPAIAIAGDWNGDGKADLAVAINRADGAGVLLGKGDGGFGSVASFPAGAGPRGIAAADLDSDGNLDFVVANSGGREGFGPPHGGSLSVLRGNGDGTFRGPADYPVAQ
ncbi:MAG: VCBS repeat-containing protein [Myxococcales bacterium]|nr:VCBS repeat-containing protein [Myxococcales bacterium]